MGQDDAALIAAGMPVHDWQETEAPARRRRWYDNGAGTLAVLLASASDVDDLIPTLVAFQIEHNKIRVRQRAAAGPRRSTAPSRHPRSAPVCSVARSTTGAACRRPGAPTLRRAWPGSPSGGCRCASGCSAAPTPATRG